MSTTNIKINSLRTEYDFLRPCTDTSLISLDNSTLSSQLNNQTTLEGVLDYLSRIYAHWWKREQKVYQIVYEDIVGEPSSWAQILYQNPTTFTAKENAQDSATYTWDKIESLSLNTSTGIFIETRSTTYSVSGNVKISYLHDVSERRWYYYTTTSQSHNPNQVWTNKYIKFKNEYYIARHLNGEQTQFALQFSTNPYGEVNVGDKIACCLQCVDAQEQNIKLSKVTSQFVSSSVEYVFSFSRNAYPDSGEVDNYIYTYLGVPFENARGG